MDEREAISQLVSDLQWQIDQIPKRGIRNAAGNPYNPSYYKRGLQNAINSGGTAVPDFVRSYLTKPASDGYKKLQAADSLDLACEALIADDSKPYAELFSDEDRAAARKRLAPYLARIAEAKTQVRDQIREIGAGLPADVDALRQLAEDAAEPAAVIATNGRLAEVAPDEVAAHIRVGRAWEELGDDDEALAAYRRALEVAPDNALAAKRLADAERRSRREGRPRPS